MTNGYMHILRPNFKKPTYKIRIPYMRKFQDIEFRSKTRAIEHASRYLLHFSFVEVYEILIDKNLYYEPTIRMIAKVWR